MYSYITFVSFCGKCNFPMSHHVRWLVGRSVGCYLCHYFVERVGSRTSKIIAFIRALVYFRLKLLNLHTYICRLS